MVRAVSRMVNPASAYYPLPFFWCELRRKKQTANYLVLHCSSPCHFLCWWYLCLVSVVDCSPYTGVTFTNTVSGLSFFLGYQLSNVFLHLFTQCLVHVLVCLLYLFIIYLLNHLFISLCGFRTPPLYWWSSECNHVEVRQLHTQPNTVVERREKKSWKLVWFWVASEVLFSFVITWPGSVQNSC